MYFRMFLCIYIIVVAKFCCMETATFRMVPGHYRTISMQGVKSLSPQKSLLHSVCGHGPLTESEAVALDYYDCVLSECRHFSASISGTKQLSNNLGSFVTSRSALLHASTVEHLVNDIANHYVSSP